MTYIFTCPHLDCDAQLEPGDGFDYWCPAEQLAIPARMLDGDAWGSE